MMLDDRNNFSRTHTVSIDECYFANVMSGRKRFEIRKDDRDYQVGDWLQLRCLNRSLMVEIIYKTTFKQQDGYCVLGINYPKHEGYPSESSGLGTTP